MKKILIIVPSRSSNGSRTNNIEELRDSWIKTTTGNSDLLIGLDEDDEHHYPRLESVKYEVNKRLRMVGTLNLLANKYCTEYEYIAFLGDDHRFRTDGWETIFLNDAKEQKYSIFYGNDLLQGANIWLELGRALSCLKYFPNLIIEHMHPAANKAKTDIQYAEVDSFTNQDRISFIHYMNTQFNNDVQKLKN